NITGIQIECAGKQMVYQSDYRCFRGQIAQRLVVFKSGYKKFVSTCINGRGQTCTPVALQATDFITVATAESHSRRHGKSYARTQLAVRNVFTDHQTAFSKILRRCDTCRFQQLRKYIEIDRWHHRFCLATTTGAEVRLNPTTVISPA